MKFEDLKLGGWYTHPNWRTPCRVYLLVAKGGNSPNSPARVSFDDGPGTHEYSTTVEGSTLLDSLTEYDEYADAKTLVEMHRSAFSGVGFQLTPWNDIFISSTKDAYKSLAAQLREQGWRGAGK
jgi:hypothetical protein